MRWGPLYNIYNAHEVLNNLFITDVTVCPDLNGDGFVKFNDANVERTDLTSQIKVSFFTGLVKLPTELLVHWFIY